HGAVGRINREPLEELVSAVVDPIVVHARGRRPGAARICRTGDKYIEIAVAIVTPRHVETFAPRIQGDLRKSVGSLERLDGKHGRSGVENGARTRKPLTTIAGGCKHDVVVLTPHDEERAIGRDRSSESLRSAVVIAGKS